MMGCPLGSAHPCTSTYADVRTHVPGALEPFCVRRGCRGKRSWERRGCEAERNMETYWRESRVRVRAAGGGLGDKQMQMKPL